MAHEAKESREQGVNVVANQQYATFFVAERMYGIDVLKVQEVVKPMRMTRIPLGETFVKGLINLRGQVATAIDLRELFSLTEDAPSESMNVVCRCEGNLISLLVDDIGDVIEVARSDFVMTPKTTPEAVRKYMSGVYQLEESLLSVIDIERLFKRLNT